LSDPVETVKRFYSAFGERDHVAMNACYHPDIQFRDELFILQGKRVFAMWHMLCAGAPDLTIKLVAVEATIKGARANWQALYTFGATDRVVLNRITAEFEFKDGLIIHHQDDFSFWRWSRQALGLGGLVLGWNRSFRKRVALASNRTLDRFIAKHPEYQDS